MGTLNIHEVTSWAFWMFKSWFHGHFEYLWGDIGILNTKWRYGIIQKLTPWVFWIFIVKLFLIFIQNYVVFWIFIVMTSLQEYSKYPWRQEYSIFPWRQGLWVFKINMTHFMSIQNTHGVSLWIFKLHMTSLHAYSKYPWRRFWYSKYPWRQLEYSLNYRWPHLTNTQITHEVMSIQKTNYITPSSLHEFSKHPWRQHSNIQITHKALVFWIFTKWRHGYFEYSKEV